MIKKFLKSLARVLGFFLLILVSVQVLIYCSDRNQLKNASQPSISKSPQFSAGGCVTNRNLSEGNIFKIISVDTGQGKMQTRMFDPFKKIWRQPIENSIESFLYNSSKVSCPKI